MIEMLASTGGIPPEMVGAVLASLIGGLIGGGFLGKKVSDSTRTTIDPQPLMVKMQEEFVTRREFDKLETLVAVNAAKSEGYLRQASEQMTAAVTQLTKSMERQHERLTNKIEEVATNDFEGRKDLWEKLNDSRARLKSVEDRMPAKPTPRG